MQQQTTQQDAQTAGGLFPARTYLDEGTRRATVQELNQVLADTTDLATQAKYAHWNVKGFHFYQLHELFEEIYEAFEAQTDEVAERITALGGRAMGTTRMAAANTAVPEVDATATTGPEFVSQLADRLATHDTHLYHFIRRAEERGDLDTADLLNEISREVTHYLWFLDAHLQGEPAPAGGWQGGTAQLSTNQQVQAQAQAQGQP